MVKTTGKSKEEKEKKTCKIVFEEKVTCPHCSENIILRKEKHLLKAAQPAEYSEKMVVEKDAQQTIEQSVKNEPKLDQKSEKKAQT
jgi:hypothetical protein